uniref:Dof-type domain-containing protein n=1 Tax=Ananas comosus var. bracteatus TaxID=296719 RepID=A0A6V7PRH5_ANACO|nr:unnamed protein product [Ananas comosus var. bracteatus]
MFELRDPAIKLFGRTIPLPEAPPLPPPPPEEEEEEAEGGADPAPPSEPSMEAEQDTDKEIKETEVNSIKPGVPEEDHPEPNCSSGLESASSDDLQTPACEDKSEAELKSEQVKSEGEGSNQDSKALKKPDKVLPCPRCNSMDTKFCYYNNYNVNQPRHFCKNCQRYWTAGGSMRNVPVGAGRRKNKNSCSQFRHIMLSSDGMAAGRADTPDFTNHQAISCGPGPSVPRGP